MQAVLCAQSPAPAAERNPRFTGTPILRSWTGEDYGGSPVCQSIAQHPVTGFIYVGTNGGLLEFDGARWRPMETPGGPMPALAFDRRGRTWFMGEGKIGYVAPDEQGQMRVVSAKSRLPADERELAAVVGALAADGGIYCGTLSALHFLDDRDTSPARTLPLPEPLRSLWATDGALHLTLQNGASFRVRAGKLEPLETKTTEILARAGELFLTARGPVPAATADIFEGDFANAAIVLADGRCAFGTERSGLVVCDRAGRVVQRIDRSLGLPSNRVYALCEDREGGVWLATHRGVTRVQLDTPFAVQGPAQGFDSNPTAVQRIGGRLLVTTTEGIGEFGADGKFTVLRGLPGEPAQTLAGIGPLFTSAALQRGLPADISPPARTRTPYHGALKLAGPSGVFVLGSYDGVWLVRATGSTWTQIGKVRGTERYNSVTFEAPAGRVWVVDPDGRLAMIDFRNGATVDAPVRTYGIADGLPADRFSPGPGVFRFAGSINAVIGARIFRYEIKTDRFRREVRIEGLPNKMTSGLQAGTRFNTDADGTTWLLIGPHTRRIQRVVPTGRAQWRAESFDTSQLGARPAAIFHDPATSSLWLSVQSGPLITMDLNWRPTRPPVPLTVGIRRIETLGRTLISGRDGPVSGAVKLTPAQTALRILFAAPRFAPGPDGQVRLSYRTRLDGLESEWTEWSQTPFREFTNLPWRPLTFRVQARDFTGRVSAEDSLAFVIAAPWWATRPALGGYALCGLGALSGIVWLRTRALRRRADHLETVVAARTTELASKNVELTRLHKLELDEKTAARLAEEKTRLEMLRYQLNPHFLANSLAALRTLVGPQATGAREMIERLASFCRMALTRRDEHATVREEIEMLRAYLDTEKSRWREMLEVSIDADPAALEVALPPFLLLPLVENAIKYGGQTSPDKLGLRLEFRADPNGTLRIRISNTGKWIPPETTGNTADSGHIGLDNLRQRLRRHYPEAHTFTTGEENGWVVARIDLSLSSFSSSPSGRSSPAPDERER